MTPSAAIHVVLARPEHLDAVARLLAEVEVQGATQDHPTPTDVSTRKSEILHGLLGEDSTACLLALRSDIEAVGLVIAVRIPKLDSRVGFLYVDELFVRVDWRRQGVGTALVEHTVSLARSLGLSGVRLLARPENTTAQAFYKSLGFSGSSSILFQRRIESQRSQS